MDPEKQSGNYNNNWKGWKMFALYNEFRDCIESKHRTVKAAAKAGNRLVDQCRRNNGPTSYIPWSIRPIEGGQLGRAVDIYDHWEPSWEK